MKKKEKLQKMRDKKRAKEKQAEKEKEKKAKAKKRKGFSKGVRDKSELRDLIENESKLLQRGKAWSWMERCLQVRSVAKVRLATTW